MLANFAITNMETISLFTDSSIDNVMLQTHPDFTRRFINSQTFLNVIWLTHCCTTVKFCTRLALRGHRSGHTKFIGVFIISTHILLGLISTGSAEADIGWGGNLNSHLIAMQLCQKCVCQNCWNLIIILRATVNNVGCFYHVLCIFQHIFRLVLFLEVVQKQTLGEVKNWTAI